MTRNEVYPRIFDCLFNYCPSRRPECDRCDAVEAARQAALQQDEHVWAWRSYRHHLYGFYAGIREIGVSFPIPRVPRSP